MACYVLTYQWVGICYGGLVQGYCPKICTFSHTNLRQLMHSTHTIQRWLQAELKILLR